MRISIIFFALFHAGLMYGQDKDTPENKIHHSILCLGDNMVLGEKTIKIKKVISDSRCPKGVTCIWAGEVKVLVEFYDNGKFKGDKIITGSNIRVGETEIIPGFNISIADFFNTEELDIRKFVVTPYPEAGYKISQEEYSVELTVSEGRENN